MGLSLGCARAGFGRDGTDGTGRDGDGTGREGTDAWGRLDRQEEEDAACCIDDDALGSGNPEPPKAVPAAIQHYLVRLFLRPQGAGTGLSGPSRAGKTLSYTTPVQGRADGTDGTDGRDGRDEEAGSRMQDAGSREAVIWPVGPVICQ